ncbi:kinase-like protein [Ceratobasidium sp. AG-I]|nr:kinase-like protein [Ceratobasidium sp. AG-I]
MPSVRDSISSLKGYLGLPKSTSKKNSRPTSPSASPGSGISQTHPQSENVDIQDGTSTTALASLPTLPTPTPTPTQSTHNHDPSLEVPTTNNPTLLSTSSPQNFPCPHSPSVTPVPDNEVRAQASLSTQCAMSFAAVVQELAPIPGIGSLVGCLTLVFQAVEKARVNKEQWELLRGRCVMVTRIAGAQVINYGGTGYPSLENSVGLLEETITDIGQRAAYYNDMHEIFALFQYRNISEEIRGHFVQLDVCLRMFSYAADVTQMQWIGEFSAVQRTELHELEEMKKLIIGLNGNVDAIGKTNEQVRDMVSQVDEKLQKVLEDKSEILQSQGTTTMATYADAEKIVKTIRGEKVAKKVFRVGTSDEEHVRKYAERFLRDAKLWWTLRSDYTLPFYGIGMEAYAEAEANHFQLYMVSPLMKNYDAVTYLKQYRTNAGINRNIMRIITDATRGLQYLHNREPPVVHSGMRGSNILVTDSGGGILGGFGLTKALRSRVENKGEKIPPAVLTGKTESQRWMAPELFECDLPELRTSCDIWGWAMATLELVSGKVPYFNYKKPHLLAFVIAKGDIPNRKDYVEFDKYALRPDELWTLLEKCWTVEPTDRPTIDDVLVELERIKGIVDVN